MIYDPYYAATRARIIPRVIEIIPRVIEIINN